jgi:hypothetical protein
MGYNTTVIVMNDALGQIEEDPDFGKKLAAAIRGLQIPEKYRSRDVSAGYHVNAAAVIESHHADFIRIVAVGGNMGWRVESVAAYRAGPMGPEKQVEEEILQRFATKFGYRLVKDTRIKDPEFDGS